MVLLLPVCIYTVLFVFGSTAGAAGAGLGALGPFLGKPSVSSTYLLTLRITPIAMLVNHIEEPPILIIGNV